MSQTNPDNPRRRQRAARGIRGRPGRNRKPASASMIKGHNRVTSENAPKLNRMMGLNDTAQPTRHAPANPQTGKRSRTHPASRYSRPQSAPLPQPLLETPAPAAPPIAASPAAMSRK